MEEMTRHATNETRRRIATAALGLAAMLAATPAPGAEGDRTAILNRVTAGIVSDTMKEHGYAAYVDKDGEGDPMVVATADGTRFGVIFFDCEKAGAMPDRSCTDVEFTALYTLKKKPSLEALNAWNAGNGFGKAYLRDDGDVALEMPVNLADGISISYLDSTLEWWDAVRQGFEKHIGWK